MKYSSFDHFFFTLGNKQRVRILQLLAEQGPKNVSNISTEIGVEQSAVSHSLKQLLHCHFVDVKRNGKARIYSVNEYTVKPLLEHIDRHVRTYCVKACEHTKD